MLYFQILDGLGRTIFGAPWRKPPNTTRLINESRCGNIFGPTSLLPMCVDSWSGIPWILSSLMSPLPMMVFLAMVAAQWVQIYGGLDSELLSGHPMSSESSLPDMLCDFIREYGAMEGLKSDNAKSETSFAMKDIFRMYTIKDQQSEPHYQHQNPIKQHIQDLKRMVHGIMDRVGCPAPYWLLCILYVIGLLNVLANSKGMIPLTVVTGAQTDVSPYLDFHFWQEVFVEVPGGGEQLACWCSPSHKQGDFLTYHVLLDNTKQLVMRSTMSTQPKTPYSPTVYNDPPWQMVIPLLWWISLLSHQYRTITMNLSIYQSSLPMNSLV